MEFLQAPPANVGAWSMAKRYGSDMSILFPFATACFQVKCPATQLVTVDATIIFPDSFSKALNDAQASSLWAVHIIK